MNIAEQLKQFENVDWNDFSAWPLVIKFVGVIVVGIGILIAGYIFVIQGEIEDLNKVQKQEKTLRQTFSNKKALAINLPAYKRQMEEMNQTFGSLLRQLPNSTEVPDLLVDITQAGLGRGLNFVLFKPGKERKKGFYAELPINLKVTGTYHELALFISDVSALPRIVTIGNISLSKEKGKNAAPDQLSMKAIAKTYRYIKPGEGGGNNNKGKNNNRRKRR
ncbi:MAG: type 4a pilus biogenesis protein PilO [Acidiferrobacterales bacterium]